MDMVWTGEVNRVGLRNRFSMGENKNSFEEIHILIICLENG